MAFGRTWGLVLPSTIRHKEDAKTAMKLTWIFLSFVLMNYWIVVVSQVWRENRLQVDTVLNQTHFFSKGSTTLWMAITIPWVKSSNKQFILLQNSTYA